MGHTAIKETRYSASAYLARILGQLRRRQVIAYHPGKPPAGGPTTPTSRDEWMTDPGVNLFDERPSPPTSPSRTGSAST